MNKKVYVYLKNCFDYFEKKEQMRTEKLKNRVVNDLDRSWSIEEIRDYNIGYKYRVYSYYSYYEQCCLFTEQDIKLGLLNEYSYLFTLEEYEQFYNKITGTKTLNLK